jgi:hypothetical protein
VHLLETFIQSSCKIILLWQVFPVRTEPSVNAMRRMDAVELQLHWLLIYASDASVWLVARPGYSNSEETAAASMGWYMGSRKCEKDKNIFFSENWNTVPRMSRPQASHYSDWAILTLGYCLCQYIYKTFQRLGLQFGARKSPVIKGTWQRKQHPELRARFSSGNKQILKKIFCKRMHSYAFNEHFAQLAFDTRTKILWHNLLDSLKCLCWTLPQLSNSDVLTTIKARGTGWLCTRWVSDVYMSLFHLSNADFNAASRGPSTIRVDIWPIIHKPGNSPTLVMEIFFVTLYRNRCFLALFIYPDDGGSRFLWNVGRYIPNYRAFNLTRQYNIPVIFIHTAIRISNLTGIYNFFFNHSYYDGMEEEEEVTWNIV